MADINAWLSSPGLGRYAEIFAENDIDLEVLPELEEKDLESLGLSLGHRKKLLKAAVALATDTPPPSAQPEAATPAEPVGERRQVTVLFVDLSGFTKLSNQSDPEDIHKILNVFFESTDAIIEDFGGTIDKHIGDNVMAVFGAPVAHDDDAMRAVRAALAIHQAIPDMSRSVGTDLAVHIGIASGEVVASRTGSEAHREYTVTGNSVNLASRLDDMAGPGETFISDAVYRAVGRLAECDAVGDTAVKGVDEPVMVWRVRALAAQDRGGADLPFVGRAAERRQFAGALEACRETGHGHAIHLRGEAGIGKSRLVEEFRCTAEAAGFDYFTGQVLDFGAGKGQDAIRAIVRGLLGLTPADRVEARLIGAQKALADGLVETNDAVFLHDLLELPQSTEARGLYDAMENTARNSGKRDCVAKLMQKVAAQKCMFITVEDIHWANDVTMAHLATLVATCATCPALLVMTSRVEGDPVDQTWRAATGGASLMTIDLGPLQEAEALEMADTLVAAGAHLRSAVVDRAEGNPLFLEQLVYNAEVDRGASIPGSIQSLILARMDRLQPADRHALQAAAIIGQRFSIDTLRHLVDDPAFECDQLVAHNLVRPAGAEMLFAHALIRDGAYSTLLSTTKAALHRRAADWFQDRDLILHAEHLDRASDPDAPAAYLAASQAEADAFRHERALGLAERGLALADEDRFPLASQRAELLARLGRSKESIAAYREAQAHARTQAEHCQSWIGVAAGVRLLGGADEGIEALDKAEPAARQENLHSALAQIFFYRGTFSFAEGDIDACQEQYNQAIENARRAEDHEWRARGLGGLGDANYARGRMGTAMELFRECISIARAQSLGRIEIGNRFVLGVARRYINEIDEAFADCRAAAELAEKVGDKRTHAYALNILGEFLTDKSDPAAAEEPIAQALEIMEGLGNRRFTAYIMNQQARQLLLAGQRAEARQRVALAYELSRETGPTFIGARILGTTALCASDGAKRAAALKEGEGLLGQGCIAHNHLWFYRDAIEASLEMAAWNDAVRYADALESYTSSEPLPWSNLFIARGRALAAWGRGVRDAATRATLDSIRKEATRIGLLAPVPALEKVLAA